MIIFLSNSMWWYVAEFLAMHNVLNVSEICSSVFKDYAVYINENYWFIVEKYIYYQSQKQYHTCGYINCDYVKYLCTNVKITSELNMLMLIYLKLNNLNVIIDNLLKNIIKLHCAISDNFSVIENLKYLKHFELVCNSFYNINFPSNVILLNIYIYMAEKMLPMLDYEHLVDFCHSFQKSYVYNKIFSLSLKIIKYGKESINICSKEFFKKYKITCVSLYNLKKLKYLSILTLY